MTLTVNMETSLDQKRLKQLRKQFYPTGTISLDDFYKKGHREFLLPHRTTRYYVSKGLLPKPQKKSKVAFYDLEDSVALLKLELVHLLIHEYRLSLSQAKKIMILKEGKREKIFEAFSLLVEVLDGFLSKLQTQRRQNYAKRKEAAIKDFHAAREILCRVNAGYDLDRLYAELDKCETHFEFLEGLN